MKKQLYIGSFFALILSTILLAASGTPSTIRVNTDSSGNLLVASATLTGATTSSVFSNTRLNTDASGNLLVALSGGVTPTFPLLASTSTDCTAPPYSFVGRTTTGLNSQATNTWNLCGGGTLGLSGNTTAVTLGLPLTFPNGTVLTDDAINVLAQRNGTNPQAFNIYNTFTDASNYERGFVKWVSSELKIGTSQAGTGSARSVTFQTSGADRWFINGSGAFLSASDNSFDIGASGATRPRTGYFGASIVSPVFQGSGTGVTVANVGANSCGTSTATIAGNQVSGVVTVGTVAGTQCRLTFTTAAPVARDCTVTDSTTTIATRAAAVDASNTDLFGAFVAGDKVTYVCTVR